MTTNKKARQEKEVRGISFGEPYLLFNTEKKQAQVNAGTLYIKIH